MCSQQYTTYDLFCHHSRYEARPSPDPEEQLRNEAAAKRALEFTIGWFARPLYEGDYPAVMRARVGNRLPRFTAVQRMLLKGGCG